MFKMTLLATKKRPGEPDGHIEVPIGQRKVFKSRSRTEIGVEAFLLGIARRVVDQDIDMPKPLDDLLYHTGHRFATGNIGRNGKRLDVIPFCHVIGHCARAIAVDVDQNSSATHFGNRLGMAGPEESAASGNDGYSVGEIELRADALPGTLFRSCQCHAFHRRRLTVLPGATYS
jgi:hypothetical protein